MAAEEEIVGIEGMVGWSEEELEVAGRGWERRGEGVILYVCGNAEWR